jgi:hypothetical protein
MREAVAGIVLRGEGTTSQKDAADMNLEYNIVKLRLRMRKAVDGTVLGVQAFTSREILQVVKRVEGSS